jgi:hypothetical protein
MRIEDVAEKSGDQLVQAATSVVSFASGFTPE